MIRHTVLFKLKPNVSKQQLETIFTNIVELANHLPGIQAITGGTCYFHELNAAQPFTHGFSIDFDDTKARDSFLNDVVTHPVKNQIVDVTIGGTEGIFGFDFGEWGG